jgi:hypothetical protein
MDDPDFGNQAVIKRNLRHRVNAQLQQPHDHKEKWRSHDGKLDCGRAALIAHERMRSQWPVQALRKSNHGAGGASGSAVM